MYIYIRLLCNTLVIHFCIHIYYAIHNIDFGRLVCLVFPSPIFIDPQTKNPWGFTEPFRIIQENFTNNAILSFSTTNCGKTVNKNLNLKKNTSLNDLLILLIRLMIFQHFPKHRLLVPRKICCQLRRSDL
jgi:hypothetical protein